MFLPDIRKLANTRLSDNTRSALQVQELLNLHGYNLTLDGDFATLSLSALSKFCDSRALSLPPADGGLTPETVAYLAMPLYQKAAMLPPFELIASTKRDALRAAVKWLAWLQVDPPVPVEGDDNTGAWVRFFMGDIGQPWCCGFVTSLIKRACAVLGVRDSVFGTTYWSTSSLWNAVEKARRLDYRAVAGFAMGADHKFSIGEAGDLFLVPGGITGYTHIGIMASDAIITKNLDITKPPVTLVRTIEGNTNESGSANGVRVCARLRKQPLSFISLQL